MGKDKQPREWLKVLRKKKGYTQEQLAERVGISLPGYSLIELGITRPSVETTKKIAKELQFDWVNMFGDNRFSELKDTLLKIENRLRVENSHDASMVRKVIEIMEAMEGKR